MRFRYINFPFCLSICLLPSFYSISTPTRSLSIYFILINISWLRHHIHSYALYTHLIFSCLIFFFCFTAITVLMKTVKYDCSFFPWICQKHYESMKITHTMREKESMECVTVNWRLLKSIKWENVERRVKVSKHVSFNWFSVPRGDDLWRLFVEKVRALEWELATFLIFELDILRIFDVEFSKLRFFDELFQQWRRISSNFFPKIPQNCLQISFTQLTSCKMLLVNHHHPSSSFLHS